MDEIIRAIGEHLHQVIVLSEKLKKELPELEAKAAGLGDKAQEYDRLSERVNKKASELVEISEKHQKVSDAIADLKKRL
jgi:predicted nuclease with TOPRIM domain